MRLYGTCELMQALWAFGHTVRDDFQFQEEGWGERAPVFQYTCEIIALQPIFHLVLWKDAFGSPVVPARSEKWLSKMVIWVDFYLDIFVDLRVRGSSYQRRVVCWCDDDFVLAQLEWFFEGRFQLIGKLLKLLEIKFHFVITFERTSATFFIFNRE